MEQGNSLAFGGLSSVHLSPTDVDVNKIIEFAAKIGAMYYDDEDGEKIIVRFHGEIVDEAATLDELRARLTVPLVNG